VFEAAVISWSVDDELCLEGEWWTAAAVVVAAAAVVVAAAVGGGDDADAEGTLQVGGWC
jgi:hypothetical protein